MTDLLPCPCCGSADVRIHDHGPKLGGLHHGERVYTLGCYQCGLQLPGQYEEYGRAQLVEKWNRRAATSTPLP